MSLIALSGEMASSQSLGGELESFFGMVDTVECQISQYWFSLVVLFSFLSFGMGRREEGSISLRVGMV